MLNGERARPLAFVSLIVDKGSPRRINISLDYGLLHAIDDEAKRRRHDPFGISVQRCAKRARRAALMQRVPRRVRSSKDCRALTLCGLAFRQP